MSLKTKITLLSVAVTGTVVVALFFIQANNVVESWLANTHDTAELAGNHVKHLLTLRLQQQPVSGGAGEKRQETWDSLLRSDRQFRSLLESTMAHAKAVVEVSISGRDGRIVASSSPFRENGITIPLPELAQLRGMAPFRRMLRVMNSRTNYQVAMPIGLASDPAPIYTIQVIVSPILVREALRPALLRVAEWGTAGIFASVLLAWGSARLLTGNLSHISTALDRITRGEEPGRWEKHDQLKGEFEAIESKLNVLGHQFRGAAQLRGALDKVLDGMREGILLLGEDGTVTLAGGAVEDVLGVRAADLNGRALEQIIPPGTPSAEELVRSYHAHSGIRERWLELPGQAGRRLIVNLDFTGNGGDPGKSALLRIRDAAGHTELESQVGMIARMDAITRLTSSVAHEIKNPLNSLAVRLDNLQARAESEFPEAEEEITLIVREIERLDRVVRTFLDFTRPTEIANEWFSVTQLAGDVVTMVEPDASRTGIETHFEHPAEDIWVKGDEDLLKEAILNVVRNGLEAMPNGGELRLRLEQDGNSAHILIADTGAGIPEARKEKIFELYYTTKKNGSGLGLPMAFRAVQLHGGTIDFDSRANRGTTFRLSLPLDAAKETAAV